MNKKIFVDTGAWFAIADKHDQFHRKASDHIKRIVENSNNLVTSTIADCVSFVLMKKLEIKRVFAFDKHLKTMRFIIEP
jgi:predicted nucleic acid-binding protein